MQTILITGGTGLIGKHLIPKLAEKGYNIRVLSRSKNPVEHTAVFKWDVEKGIIEDGALDNVDHIIHLAGYSVSEGRWNAKRKKLIYDSRIKAIELLISKLGNQQLQSFISASGVSIYGTVTTDKIFKEEDALTTASGDFLAEVSIDWEKAALACNEIASRVVIMRTPVVLGDEGALPRISKPIKIGIGSALGTGKQWVPWIHIEDIASAYVYAVENDNLKGIYNISAPEHITNKALIMNVARVLNKKLWAPKVPAFVLKLLFGDMANIILKGSRVNGDKFVKEGFELEHPTLKESLEDLLKN
ncbi:TIGR01777 family oxidoreductase [Paracrocinitomix mangrovi]|uniref:TIGR01777 family oxidoreductase n=1 Tax=Paracrocinitomix mangrovi TaxID=2862509 RepID=UPI001C8EDA6D|nr:TIGR01777 family oxidoreductase [Paracrocinitomix mangrovi]UKN03377.1 TIGR01777 family oxidoreductase [Paracrocinitomix mangrovi]